VQFYNSGGKVTVNDDQQHFAAFIFCTDMANPHVKNACRNVLECGMAHRPLMVEKGNLEAS
jgi:hypothetical protein